MSSDAEQLGAGSGEDIEETRAVRILKKLGLADRIGIELEGDDFVLPDGRQARTEDFEEFCRGPRANMMLAGLDAVTPDHPRFEAMKTMAFDKLGPYLNLG